MPCASPGSDDEASKSVACFFDQFDAAFRSFDGTVIAERYAEPYLACRGDGSSELFATRQNTARYFQRVLDEYFAMGVRSCRHRDIQVMATGECHNVGTVTWDLLDDAADIVTSWRESYLLVYGSENMVVRSSIDH